jgi:hypothetical protein
LHWQDTLHTKTLLPGYSPLSVSQVCHSWYSLIDMDERLVDLDIDFLLRFYATFLRLRSPG